MLQATEPDSLSEHAAALARRGWHVFPCRPGDKRPSVRDWEHRACPDPERVARYWPGGANAGIACGPSGLVVIDLDCHGELPAEWRLPGVRDGRDVLAQLCEWASQPWPSTYTVATPSGGWHLYFAAPDGSVIRNSASLIGPQIDVRGQGGYVVGAGSVVGGRRYEAMSDIAPASLPPWIARLLAPAGHAARRTSPGGHRRVAALCRLVEDAPEGQRNTVLHWSACRGAEVVAAGQADARLIADLLVSAAVAAGLPADEARRTVASGMGSAR